MTECPRCRAPEYVLIKVAANCTGNDVNYRCLACKHESTGHHPYTHRGTNEAAPFTGRPHSF